VAPDNEPGFHEYVVAPEDVSVTDVPAQTVDEEAAAVTVGVVITVRVTVRVLVQPRADAPVTV
jgi:hypothetical protein